MSKRKNHTKNRASHEKPRRFYPTDNAATRRKAHRQDAARREAHMVEQQVESIDQSAKSREYLERLQEETYARLAVDDSRHRPGKADPLTSGANRVTGMTAKAVRRSTAMTKFEHDQAKERRR